MRRRLTKFAASLAFGASVLPARAQPQAFRVVVDLAAVDVQVIDREGRPVAGLGPDAFEVTINGRRHRVVSAELIDSHTTSGSPEYVRFPLELFPFGVQPLLELFGGLDGDESPHPVMA
jgi:hypothetical protein